MSLARTRTSDENTMVGGVGDKGRNLNFLNTTATTHILPSLQPPHLYLADTAIDTIPRKFLILEAIQTT
jgi:hypothetical protein